MDQGEVLLFNPVTVSTLCNAAESPFFLVIAFASEDKVPDIIVRTALSGAYLIRLVNSHLHVINKCPVVDQELDSFVLMHSAIECPLEIILAQRLQGFRRVDLLSLDYSP